MTTRDGRSIYSRSVFHAVFLFGAGIGDVIMMTSLFQNLNNQSKNEKVLLVGHKKQEAVLKWTVARGLADQYILSELNPRSPWSVFKLIWTLTKFELSNLIIPHTLRTYKILLVLFLLKSQTKLIIGYQKLSKFKLSLLRASSFDFKKNIPIHTQYLKASEVLTKNRKVDSNMCPISNKSHALVSSDSKKQLVGLHFGSLPERESKTLLPMLWIPLLQMLEKEGYSFVLFGGPTENIGINWQDIMPSVQDKTGMFGLEELTTEISKCSLFITNDGGPMHLAGYLDIPTIAFFGPTNPNMYRPMATNFFLLQPNCSCRHSLTQVGGSGCPNPEGPICRNTEINSENLAQIFDWIKTTF